MPVALVLPDGFQYVPAAFVASVWVVGWQVVQVGTARKKAKIPYPELYADKSVAAASKDALVFNCVQRAHQNTLENLPLLVMCTAVTAVKYPVLAAALYGAWTAFRIPYTIGYRTGDPDKRNSFYASSLTFFALIGILGSSTFTVAKLFNWV